MPILNNSGEFDEDFYRQLYPDLKECKVLFGHYFKIGGATGRKPNRVFDPHIY